MIEKDEPTYKWYCYLAHTGALKLWNMTQDELDEVHDNILKGEKFMIILDDGREWLLNPEYVIHTEVHSG